MAGDWIAIRSRLHEEPEVVRLTSAICPDSVQDVSAMRRCRDRMVGALVRTWTLFDSLTEDGLLVGYDPEVLDLEIGIEGWTGKLEAVGWMEVTSEGLRMPGFATWLGASAKRRLKDSKRKRSVRKTSASDADKNTTRGEERRVEKKKKNKQEEEAPPYPDELVRLGLIDAVDGWLAYKRERKESYKPRGLQAFYAQVVKLAEAQGPDVVREAMASAMASNWAGWTHGVRDLAARGPGRAHNQDLIDSVGGLGS